MVHAAVLSFVISDEPIDKRRIIYTRRRKTQQPLFCDCISSVFLQKIIKLFETDGIVSLSRHLKATNLFITSRHIAVANREKRTDR